VSFGGAFGALRGGSVVSSRIRSPGVSNWFNQSGQICVRDRPLPPQKMHLPGAFRFFRFGCFDIMIAEMHKNQGNYESDLEIERRRDAALLRALSTPHKRQKEMKIGRRAPKARESGERREKPR
jgi:hypothetical protein